MANSDSKTKNNRKSYKKYIICEKSQSVAIDVMILLAVITSCSFLIFPYVKFISFKSLQLFINLKKEFMLNSIMYSFIAFSFFLCVVALSVWLILTNHNKCGKPNCKGLKKSAVEFEILLENEDCVKSLRNINDGNKKGLFEVFCDQYRGLEGELKKIAPVNGKAVLVFRGKCGCCIGRFEVLGPKKMQQRKIKKMKDVIFND